MSHQYRGGAPGSITPSGGQRDTLIPTGVFPCADGYMAMMSTPQQLQEMLDVLDNDDLRAAFARPDAFERGDTKEFIDAALYPWLLSHTRAEATAEAQAAGWPLAGVNSPQEVLKASHLHQRGFWVHSDDPVVGPIDLPGPPHRLDEGGWALRRAAPVPSETGPVGFAPRDPASAGRAGKQLPLEGIRVLDMTTVWAGPYATMLLADLGAEVIRVENPFVLPPTTKGYTARPVISDLGSLSSGYGPLVPGRPDRPWNRHSMNNCLCRNKLSCTIDTRQPEGMDVFLELVERCDVFVENFKASGLAHMGIHTSVLQARNPRLVILRLPPAGLYGDWSGYTGFGAQFDGLTSLLWLCGHRDADLTSSPATTYMDAASGPAGAFAVMTALHYRDATGRGQLVEMAQSENVLNHLGDVFVDAQLGIPPERTGNRDPRRAPQGVYRCRDDRWLAVSVGDDDGWVALAGALGVAPDPRFADLDARLAHHDELDEILARWAKEHDAGEAFHRLQAAGVPAAPLLDDIGFSTNSHVVDRGFLRPLAQTDVGTHLHPGQPYRGVPQAWRRASPNLGEDNEYVYKTVLGVSDADYERYQKLHIIAEDYLSAEGEPL
jgi:crotonobetainyl-CoA:carnitine CoA-transferase CaiB-like acyl-CoA transferase